jgi:toxin secretion/phage lysis holin
LIYSLGKFDITTVVGNIWYFVIALIVFDVITGLLASVVEKKINSSISYRGLIKKVGLFLALAFCVFIDAYINANGYIIKMGIGLIVACESISIVENFKRVGIDLKFITKYFGNDKANNGDDKGA